MSDDPLQRQLSEERAGLEAFGTEVRRYLAQLSQEIEKDYRSLINRLSEQQQFITEHYGDAMLRQNAQESLGPTFVEGLQGSAARGFSSGGYSILGHALQTALGASVAARSSSGGARTRTILRRVASVLGAGLSQEITEAIGGKSSGGVRLSRAQAAYEQSRILQQAQRNL